MIKANSSSASPCGNETSSNCVVWQGSDIACLGIEKGQTISVAMKLVADEVCVLMDTLDLSDLDLKCVFDLCISCPEPEKTLKTVLQLIINKICTIQDIIDSLELSSGSGSDPIILLASCFQYTDADGDLITELPHSSYTKRIANQVCQLLLDVSTIKDDISNLQVQADDLQVQINNLNMNIPDVTSDCLFVGTKSIDDAWDVLDQAFCQLRTSVGLTTEINLAIARQCSGLNTDLGSTPGWTTSPQNLAQSFANLWIAFCDIRDRVVTIEDTCCKTDCSDVKLGFSAAYNDDASGIILKFTSGAGTSIPVGFSDQGSTGTITDIDGNVESFTIAISNNLTEEIAISGLNTNGALTIDITAVIGDGTVTCEKCLTKKMTAAQCAFCEITASGADGSSAVIIYESTTSSVVVEASSTTTTTSSSTTTTTTTGAPA